MLGVTAKPAELRTLTELLPFATHTWPNPSIAIETGVLTPAAAFPETESGIPVREKFTTLLLAFATAQTSPLLSKASAVWFEVPLGDPAVKEYDGRWLCLDLRLPN